jgi:hypothetical protein
MRRHWPVIVLLVLGGCGGSTTTNYADPPPMAEIVATPTPAATDAPADTAPDTPDAALAGNDDS